MDSLGNIRLPSSVLLDLLNPAETQAMQNRARMRQETINKRSKDFTCLSQTWTHDPGNHWLAFHSIAVILQRWIDAGEKLFAVAYRDPPYAPPAVLAVDDDIDEDL